MAKLSNFRKESEMQTKIYFTLFLFKNYFQILRTCGEKTPKYILKDTYHYRIYNSEKLKIIRRSLYLGNC